MLCNISLPNPIIPKRNSRLIAVLIFAGTLPQVYATDYSASANIDMNASHNDNLRLTESDKTAIYKYEVNPTIILGADTETTRASLSSTLNFNRYDKSEFNSNDQNLLLSLSHQFEMSSIGLTAGLIRNSIVTSELLTSGRIGDKAERAEQYRIAPFGTYTLNENNILQLQANYSTRVYHTEGYFGDKTAQVDASWIYLVNERIKLVGTATYADTKYDDVKYSVPDQATPLPFPYRELPKGFFGEQSYYTRIQDKGFQLGVDYQWSESSLLQARFGRSRDRITYPLHDPDDICNDPIYLQGVALGLAPYIGARCDIPSSSSQLSTAMLNWDWRNERQKFSLNAQKSTQPSSNGYSVDALQVSSDWNYSLTEQDEISTHISLVRNRAISNKNVTLNLTTADRDYESISLTYRRHINENWSVQARYRFDQQKYTETDYKANSKLISVGITYQPQDWHWSR